MTTFDPKMAELHLGVLQNRLAKCRGHMNAASLRIDMREPEKQGIDVETEKLNFKKWDQKHRGLEKDIEVYEDKVLKLTSL